MLGNATVDLGVETPICVEVHLWDFHNTDHKFVGIAPSPSEYTQPSASTKHLIAIKMHQNIYRIERHIPKFPPPPQNMLRVSPPVQ